MINLTNANLNLQESKESFKNWLSRFSKEINKSKMSSKISYNVKKDKPVSKPKSLIWLNSYKVVLTKEDKSLNCKKESINSHSKMLTDNNLKYNSISAKFKLPKFKLNLKLLEIILKTKQVIVILNCLKLMLSLNKPDNKFNLCKESKINLINANKITSSVNNKFKLCKLLFNSPRIKMPSFRLWLQIMNSWTNSLINVKLVKINSSRRAMLWSNRSNLWMQIFRKLKKLLETFRTYKMK